MELGWSLDPRQAGKLDQERSLDAFEVNSPPPKPVLLWINGVNPVTKKPRELIGFDWQKGVAEAVVNSLEIHTHAETLSIVKRRQALDKLDTRDAAQSLFSSDRFGTRRAEGRTLFELRQPTAANATANAVAAALAALVTAQDQAIDALVNDANSSIVEADRAVLKMYGQLTDQEFVIIDEYLRVFDRSLCHFVFDICQPQVRRFLNAARVTSEASANPVTYKWEDYRKLLLNRLQDSTRSNDLLKYLLGVRDEALTVSLWCSERRSERALLEKDGITLPEETWLEYVLCFIPNEERQILEVPPEKDRKAFNNNAGYKMSDLEAEVAKTDPSNFKRFRQQYCTGFLAKKLLRLHRLSMVSSQPPKDDEKKGELSTQKTQRTKTCFSYDRMQNAKNQPKLNPEKTKLLDLPTSLPKKDGSPDESITTKWKEGSLRSRTWKAVKEVKCIRCNGDHLRSACTLPPKEWEEDFNKGSSFWNPPSKRTQRCQWTDLDHGPSTLAITTNIGLVGIDTCSDISTGNLALLANLRPCAPITISTITADLVLDAEGEFPLLNGNGRVTFVTVYAVTSRSLPPNHAAILGMPSIVDLRIPLDSLVARPFAFLCDILPGSNHWDQVRECDVQSVLEYSDFGDDGIGTEFELPRDQYYDSLRAPSDTDSTDSLPDLLAISSSSDSSISGESASEAYEPPPIVERIRKDVATPVHSERSWFMALLSFALFLVAYVVLWTAQLGESRTALLPGGFSGHSLFAYLPYANRGDLSHDELPSLPPPNMDFFSADSSVPPDRFCFVQTDTSSFVGGAAMKATIEVIPMGHQTPITISTGVDTLSNVSLATRAVLSNVHPVSPDQVQGSGGVSVFQEEGLLDIFADGNLTRIPALVASPSQLPSGTQALLGMPAILDLGVILDEQKLSQGAPLVCHLGEKTLRAWWELHKGESVDTRPFDIASIDINPELPPVFVDRILASIRKYISVFEGHQNTLPKPFDCPHIQLKFISNAEPQAVPEPRWSYAYGQIVKKWAEDGLRNGSLEPSKSSWASRPHIVLKPPSEVTAAEANLADCKLRVCGDYRAANTQIQKMAPNLPTGTVQLEQAAGYKLYWEADSVACYNSFRLAEGESRAALAIWTPSGLVQPTVLPFGQKNSGTEAQGPYREAARNLQGTSNYVDDWLGYANTPDALCKSFDDFLRVCADANITINTNKTRIGYSSAQFFGFKVDEKGTRLADKHINPIRTLVPPRDISELRRVLGLFVVSRKYVKDFATLTKPLTDVLRGSKPVFEWNAPQQQAFDTIRDLLLGGIHLSAPNYSLPFHLATDASEDGKGACLYQLPTVPIDQQHPWSARTHCADNMAVVAFFSKAWNETQRNRPPFYLEADGLLWSMGKAKFYALSSPFPLYTYSDHMPLQWMSKSQKGPVSQFLIEELAELDYVHQYIEGKSNSVPDAASRYPLLGPRHLAPRGLTHSIVELLKRLPSALKAAAIVHVHAGQNTADAKRTIQDWVDSRSSVQSLAPISKGTPQKADLAVMIPRTEVAPVSLALYLLSAVPFAMLMPVDLVSQAYEPNIFPEAPFVAIRAKFDAAGKIAILASQMMWVLGNIPNCAPVETFSSELSTPVLLPGATSEEETFVEPVPRTVESWIEAQQTDPTFSDLVSAIPDTAVKDGLVIYAPVDKIPKIVVPSTVQEPLIRNTHVRMQHLGSAKIAAEIKRTFFWPTLKPDTVRLLKDCPQCELEKARQSTATALFSARPQDAPRARWAMDFQGQGIAETGETQALGLVDTTARFVVVIPLKDREATTFIPRFLDEIVFKHGPPDVLHSDDAQEFVSEALKLLAAALDTNTTTTLGHNARANGTIEVFWRYWNRCMRLLTDDQYKRWPAFASRITFAYNSAVHDSLGGVSPYEIYHGVPARNAFTSTAPARALDDELPSCDTTDPAEFAQAVTTSVIAFTKLASAHADYVRITTADRLNQQGHARTYAIGDKVKIRIPPSHEQMVATGRRSSHLASWRGPCTIVQRLSTSAYSMIQDSNGRLFERVLTNILPYRATSVWNAPAFDPATNDPFVPDEVIAVRDSPGTPFYLARISSISAADITVHYYGCKNRDLERAVFRPSWHLPNTNDIVLSNQQPQNTIPYVGVLDFDALRQLLVARNLEFTQARRLRRKSQRILSPVHDELFVYDD